MNKLVTLALASFALAGVVRADFMIGRVRPTMQANLSFVESTGGNGHLAYSLSLNSEDGEKDPVSFTLTEDNGIRCITVPCPSDRKVTFKITHISHGTANSDVTRYEAIEVLKNIPANVRIAPRKLFVTQSSMELVAPGNHGFQRKLVWSVEVHVFPDTVQTYQGNPEYLAVTM